MSETTTTSPQSVDPAAIAAALTPEMLSQILAGKSPELLAAFRQADEAAKDEAKRQRDLKRAQDTARFNAMGDEVDMFVDAIVDQGFEEQTWYKRVKGEKTDQVNGVGFYVSGTRTLVINGVLREVRVSTFVKWSPDGKSAPADIVNSEG